MARRRVRLGVVRSGTRNQRVELKRLGRFMEEEYDHNDPPTKITRGFVRSKARVLRRV